MVSPCDIDLPFTVTPHPAVPHLFNVVLSGRGWIGFVQDQGGCWRAFRSVSKDVAVTSHAEDAVKALAKSRWEPKG